MVTRYSSLGLGSRAACPAFPSHPPIPSQLILLPNIHLHTTSGSNFRRPFLSLLSQLTLATPHRLTPAARVRPILSVFPPPSGDLTSHLRPPPLPPSSTTATSPLSRGCLGCPRTTPSHRHRPLYAQLAASTRHWARHLVNGVDIWTFAT